jgi:hypothetical protein
MCVDRFGWYGHCSGSVVQGRKAPVTFLKGLSKRFMAPEATTSATIQAGIEKPPKPLNQGKE